MLTTMYPQFKGDIRAVFVHRLAKGIANIADITVLAPDSPVAEKFEIIDGVKIKRFSYWLNRKKQQVAYGIDTRRNLKKLGALIQFPFYFISFFKNTLLLGRSADIYHTNWTPTAGIAIITNWFSIKKKPIILTIRGSDIRYIPAFINKFIFKRVNIITVPSPVYVADSYALPGKKTTKEILDSLSNPPEILEIYDCLDETEFKITERPVEMEELEEKIQDKLVVSFLSRVDPSKDPVTFVSSIPEVIKSFKK